MRSSRPSTGRWILDLRCRVSTKKAEKKKGSMHFCLGMLGGVNFFGSKCIFFLSKHCTSVCVCHTFGKSESWHLLTSLSCFYDATPTCCPLTSREMTCTWQHTLPSFSLLLRTNMLLQTPVLTSNPVDVQRNSAASHKVKKLRIL